MFETIPCINRELCGGTPLAPETSFSLAISVIRYLSSVIVFINILEVPWLASKLGTFHPTGIC